MKVEMIKVARRIARAGPISPIFSFTDFLLKSSTMINLILGKKKEGERFAFSYPLRPDQ
jgi:hypothetical protein